MPLDHFGIRIPADKWEATRTFYEETLKSINYKVLASFLDGGVLGMGDEHPDLWLTKVDANANPGDGTHFAFRAETRAQVEEFYALGVKNGGTCNGPAGPRPHYGPTYFGGFVLDPAGNNVEVVCHAPQ
ncbi:hypothetical protein ABW19_dt0210579 [Dactylella cylindrospora]|nr:hypothetical protein ABW19_dt0210579 [Dactylella cylindrospora]